MNRRWQLAVLALAIGVCASLGGCVRRTIAIASTPADALVYVNDREVGRTPCEVQFLYYGEYDVRIKLDGYETVVGSGTATAPVWDFIGADLIAELAPLDLESRVEWNFTLQPADLSPADLLVRARQMQGTVRGDEPPRSDSKAPARGAPPTPSTGEPVGEGAIPPKGSLEVPVPPTERPENTPGNSP
ncbi:MAG: PEGA domain-containing protein [Phycisphaerales bacterium]|nr:PEGA domain-containing protein [Phycisphaerales bacterium]